MILGILISFETVILEATWKFKGMPYALHMSLKGQWALTNTFCHHGELAATAQSPACFWGHISHVAIQVGKNAKGHWGLE